MKSYVYLGVAGNQSATFVEVDDAASGHEPTEHARRLLLEHGSCQSVEIWRDEERIMVVERSDRGRRP